MCILQMKGSITRRLLLGVDDSADGPQRGRRNPQVLTLTLTLFPGSGICGNGKGLETVTVTGVSECKFLIQMEVLPFAVILLLSSSLLIVVIVKEEIHKFPL